MLFYGYNKEEVEKLINGGNSNLQEILPEIRLIIEANLINFKSQIAKDILINYEKDIEGERQKDQKL